MSNFKQAPYMPDDHPDSQDKVVRTEDRLTASFFGVVKNLSQRVWEQILPERLARELLGPPEVHLWKRYNCPELDTQLRNTEPDVVIHLPKSLIFVEVKDRSPFGAGTDTSAEQLRREWELGSILAQQAEVAFHLITLTRYSESMESRVKSILKEYYLPDNVHCLFWNKIYDSLNSLGESPDDVEGRFLKDILSLLKRYNLDKVPAAAGGRGYEHYVGQEATEAYLRALEDALPSENLNGEKLTVFLDNISDESRVKLLRALRNLFAQGQPQDTRSNQDRYKIMSNFLLKGSSSKVSDFFYELLSAAHYMQNLRLEGKSDFAVHLNTQEGPISVLTAKSATSSIELHFTR